MRHGSLFSGIGGFDLAAEWMGWDNIFHCEWNDFGQRVLKYHFPQSISYDDITKTDFSVHRGQIDILTGGFPCQPYSSAGKRLGKEDDRHLWPDMLRTIREVQPRWVVGENVRGLVNWNDGLVFDEVQSDLENEGYEVTPFILPACAVNAPHRRDRVWFVAYSKHGGHKTKREAEKETRGLSQKHRTKMGSGEFNRANISRFEMEGNAPDTDSQRLKEQGEQSLGGSKGYPKRGVLQRNAPDSGKKRFSEQMANGELARQQRLAERCQRKAWDSFPTKPPICGGDDGIPRQLDGITFPKWRNESIKAYGNAIVPQVAFQIFQAIAAYEARGAQIAGANG